MKQLRNLAVILMIITLMFNTTACSNASESKTSSNSSSKGNSSSSSDAGNTSDTGSSSLSSESGPTVSAEGGTVRIALGSEPDDFDPMLSAASDTSAVMMNVFEGLLGFNLEGEFVPAIAESHTVSGDGLTYTFKIKEGIMFHDGKACTARDVKYTYDKLAGLSGGEALSSTISSVLEKVETPDDYTAVLTLNQKDAGFLTKATVAICEDGYEGNSTMPVGTGPYKFVSYEPGQEIVLGKNENYTTRGDRMPSIDRAEFVIMTDENAKLMALKSGTLDIASISSSNISTLGDDFYTVEGPQNMVQVFALNNKIEPLNNLKVRQAICYAIDKDEIINAVVDGNGTRVDSFLSPSMAIFYNDSMTVYNLDLDKAKELLKEAGYENGFDLTVTVPSNYQMHVDTAQVIKDQLSKIGINLEINLVEWADWLQNVYTDFNYETTIIGHTGKLDPQDFLNRFESSYGKNYFQFSNADYDKLIAGAATTTDTTERVNYYKKSQQMLVDEAASVFIQDPSVIYAVSAKVQGLKIYPVSFYDLSDLTVSQ
ncbi:MAG: ABC transporter substrate-binding protein [Anaerocolumna sp.]